MVHLKIELISLSLFYEPVHFNRWPEVGKCNFLNIFLDFQNFVIFFLILFFIIITFFFVELNLSPLGEPTCVKGQIGTTMTRVQGPSRLGPSTTPFSNDRTNLDRKDWEDFGLFFFNTRLRGHGPPKTAEILTGLQFRAKADKLQKSLLDCSIADRNLIIPKRSLWTQVVSHNFKQCT